MNDAWNRAIAAGWNPPEDDGFWWREVNGKREVSYRTPEGENMDAQDAGPRYRIQRWDGKVWVSAGQQPWDVKQYAVDLANDLHRRMGDTYRVVDRLMRPVYVVSESTQKLHEEVAVELELAETNLCIVLDTEDYFWQNVPKDIKELLIEARDAVRKATERMK